MNSKKNIVTLLIAVAIAQVIGLCVYSFLPKSQFAISEIIITPESMSTFGLARLEKGSPGIEIRTASRILQSRACAEYAAAQLDQVQIEDIMRNTLVREGGGAGTLELRVAHPDKEKAVALSQLILTKARLIDQDIRVRRVASLIGSLILELTSIEKELEATNQKLEAHFLNKDVVFSDARESQGFLAGSLLHLEKEIARLSIQGIQLQKKLDKITAIDVDNLLAPEDRTLHEFIELTSNNSLSEAGALLVVEAFLLASRHGEKDLEVETATSELRNSKEVLGQLLRVQKERLYLEFSNNTESIRLIEDRMAKALDGFRKRDLSVDAVYIELETRRQSLQRSFGEFSRRILELQVYQRTEYPAFTVLSPPYIARLAGLRQLVPLILINGIAGCFLGALFVLIRFRGAGRLYQA